MARFDNGTKTFQAILTQNRQRLIILTGNKELTVYDLKNENDTVMNYESKHSKCRYSLVEELDRKNIWLINFI